MIIDVQDAEALSGPQRFVRRLFGEWGSGPSRLGGVAIFEVTVPRRKRFGSAIVDLLVLTPHRCTLVHISGFQSVQHGELVTRHNSRWSVGDRPADLLVPKSAPNPLVHARRITQDVRAFFERHDLPSEIETLVVLVPKTSSRITWQPPEREPGSTVLLVPFRKPAILHAHFQRPPAGPPRWNTAEIERALTALDRADHLPSRTELAAEGFAIPEPAAAPLHPAAPAPPNKAPAALFGPTPTLPSVLPRSLAGRPAKSVRSLPSTAETAHRGASPLASTPGDSEPLKRPLPVPDACDTAPGDLGTASGSMGSVSAAAEPAATFLARGPVHVQAEDAAGALTEEAHRKAGLPPSSASGPSGTGGLTGGSGHDPRHAEVTSCAEQTPAVDELSAVDEDREVLADPNTAADGADRTETATGGDSGAGPTEKTASDGIADADIASVGVAGAGRVTGPAQDSPAISGVSAVRDGADTPISSDITPLASSVDPQVLSADDVRPDSTTMLTGDKNRRPARELMRAFGGRAIGRERTGATAHPAPLPARARATPTRPGMRPDAVGTARKPATVAGVSLAAFSLLAIVFGACAAARFEVTDYAAMCESPRGFTEAAAYQRASVSPIVPVGDLAAVAGAGDPAVWHPVDPATVQLVACLSPPRTGEMIRTCWYEPGGDRPVGRTLNLFRAVYRVTAYEARTGRRVAVTEITGERFSADPAGTDTDICRAAATTAEEDLPGRRYSKPSRTQIHEFLDPLVGTGRTWRADR
ncbi:hypothetical protein B0T36_21970 [Nocardia donostiensis]|uniref:hypothetical protein n=1 Tax=Nocardia donostiensis TaxID=1538463 RepID=UPI0009DB131F|nr:hypothetical protein [Nocardia donostiensis]OQS12990.1 hypothetical protein B0T36_21970 [Nocardia donostiensis]